MSSPAPKPFGSLQYVSIQRMARSARSVSSQDSHGAGPVTLTDLEALPPGRFAISRPRAAEPSRQRLE